MEEGTAPIVIRNGLHALALLATVGVATTTVHVQVGAHLQSYDLARVHEAIGELEEARDVVRVRVLAQWTPERIAAGAARERDRRRAAAEARATDGVTAQL